MGLSRTEQIAAVVDAIFGQDPRQVLDPYQASGYLAITTKQLAQWRDDKTGPRYSVMPGGAIRYKRSALDAWLSKFEVETDEGGAA